MSKMSFKIANKTLWLLLICCCVIPMQVFPRAATAQTDTKKVSDSKMTVFDIPSVSGKARIDGVMDEEIWKKALKLELKYEIFPGENITPPVRTEVYLADGGHTFYVAFRAYDPKPSAIRARFTERDNIAADDWVGVSLDTFNAQRRVYNFSCNPLGVQSEAVETNNGADTSWDAIWSSAGRITSDGYVVEMAIPFSSLRFQRKDKKSLQVWGFNAVRTYPRGVEHNLALTPEDRNNFCVICQYAKIRGFKGARAGKNIEFDPSLSALITQDRQDTGASDSNSGSKWRNRDRRLDPGLTAHWGITPSITLSAAVNPDFSNVEADVAQLDINKQFALFYPEKRPFFLEGASIFQTALQAVYTRSLADPEWGVKVTGKEGRHGIGFYSVRDGITNLLFPGSYGSDSLSLDRAGTGTVLRYRHDVGKESNVGLLVTDREGGDYYNRLAGVDSYWRFSPKKFITFQFLASGTRYDTGTARAAEQPDGHIKGTALDFVFRHVSRNIGYYVNYRQVSPGFRADLGFMPQAGYRNVTGVFIAAAWGGPELWYTFMNAISSMEYEVDFDGELIYKSLNLTGNYYGPSQIQLTLHGNLGQRRFLGRTFNTNMAQGYFSIQPSGALKLWLGGSYGNQIDFVNGRPGNRVMLNPGLSYRLGRHVAVYLDHIFEQLKVDSGRLYTANVSNLRLEYHFNRRSFLRTIMQYVDYKYNVANYMEPVDPRFKHLFTQVLFSYRLNPQTMLFLGYSDDYYGLAYNPLKQTNRTVFLKVGYALVL